jgi:hypothetical protein
MFGGFYSMYSNPEILVLLGSPLFLLEGFLLNKLLTDSEIQQRQIKTPAQFINSLIPAKKNRDKIISYSVNLVTCIIFSIISHSYLPNTSSLHSPIELSVDSTIPIFIMPLYFYTLMFLWGLGIFTFFEYGKGAIRRNVVFSSTHLANLDNDTTEDLITNTFNIPTTFTDVLDITNPFAWLKTILTYIKSIYTLDGTLFKFPVFEVDWLNFAWRNLSIPSFSIFTVLAINGLIYYPDWISKVGINNPILGIPLLLLGLFTAYYIGIFYSSSKRLR